MAVSLRSTPILRSSLINAISYIQQKLTATHLFSGMSNAVAFSLYLVIYAFFISSITSGADELQMLLKLKSALQRSSTNVFHSWQSTSSPCNFQGITCDSTGSVSGIELSNQQLMGVVAFDSICELSSLEKLSLGNNSLAGAIPKELGNCVNLRYLDLSGNQFTGSFPEFSSLNQLQVLYLNSSGISGVFPWKSLQKMTNLTQLSVGDNNFDPTPFPAEIVGLKKLNWLYLTGCNLEGKIPPEIGSLTELIDFEVADNNLSGEIPESIGNLVNLWQLEIYNNSLTGKLPDGLRKLTRLEMFDASMNYLEGNLSVVKYLTNLVSLQMFENQLTGEIPSEIGEFKKLVNVSLYTNQLIGPLPQKLGSWANFDYIDVSENALTGSIPPDMCKQGTMRYLLMLRNKLSGEIPASYANCKTLLRFRISNNSLSGSVPAGIWGLPRVNIIDIALNRIEGSITSDIKNAQSLNQLYASSNNLSGSLPEEISAVTSLVAVELNNNQLSGESPSSIGKLKRLSSLKLQNNKLTGSIPTSIGSCVSLSDMNMAGNSLSGKIPSSLGSLPTLNSLNLSDNEISGEIPDSLSALRLSLFDLSNNRLSGRIPQSLSIEAYNGSFAGNQKLCSMSVNSFQRCSQRSGADKDVRTLLLCVAVGAVILLLSLAGYMHLKRREIDADRSLKGDSWDVKSFHVLKFTEDQILDSIKSENLIGRGGSGNVYKVGLPDGTDFAVKHIWNVDPTGQKKAKSSTPMLGKHSGKAKEFDAEVQTLSSIRHMNVVKLYCSITSEDSSLLVYEYMPNGSLWDRLHTCKKLELDWQTRYEIALGAAKGLEYLHHGCDRPVIHRDVKSSNILLDEFLKPRIADFGLAKIAQATAGTKDSTHVIPGTLGYIAPEYGYTYKVNEKSDVYSFGVVLMELVTGKKPIEAEFGDNKDIVSWVGRNLETKENVYNMVDKRIPDVFKDDAIRLLRISILCTATLPAVRPTMRSVVHMLEEAEPCRSIGIVISKDELKRKQGREMETENKEADGHSY